MFTSPAGYRLPEIQDEIENMINKTQKQIELLPKPPPKNALNEVAKLIKDFDSSLRMHIEGVPDKEGIIQQNRAPYGRFRSVIRRTAPEFRPFKLPTGAGAKNKTLADPEFLTHEEEGVPGEGSQGLAETPENRLIPVDEVYQRMEECVFCWASAVYEVDDIMTGLVLENYQDISLSLFSASILMRLLSNGIGQRPNCATRCSRF